MFKRTTQQRNVKGVQKKQTLKEVPNFKFPEPTTDISCNLKNGIVTAQSIVVSRKNFELGKLVNNSTSKLDLQFCSDNVKINDIKNKEGNNDTNECDIYIRNSSSSVGTSANPVKVQLPITYNAGESNTQTVNWILYSTSTNGTIEEPTGSSPNAVFVETIQQTNYTNDKLYFMYMDATNGETTVEKTETTSLWGYLKTITPTYYRTDVINNTTVYIKVAKGTKEYTISAVTKDGDTETEYTGPIYYPFRNNGTDGFHYEIEKDEKIKFSNPVIFGYSGNAGSDDGITPDTKPTTNTPIVVLGSIETEYAGTDSPFEYRYPVIFGDATTETAGVLPKKGSDNADSTRYNLNYIKVVEKDTTDGTYKEVEKPASRWIIDEECKLSKEIKYQESTSFISSTTEQQDATTTETIFDGYIFGEPILVIEGTGSLICSNSSRIQQLGAYAQPFKIDVTGVNVTINSVTEDVEGTPQTSYGKIECTTFVI